VQINAAIKFVLLVVKSYGCLLISCVGVNDVVSITYTAETKGATSSDIFLVENGPIEMLVGDRENIRAGLYTSRSRLLVAVITSIMTLVGTARTMPPDSLSLGFFLTICKEGSIK
jgi:hypothetical protein